MKERNNAYSEQALKCIEQLKKIILDNIKVIFKLFIKEILNIFTCFFIFKITQKF